MFGQGQKQQWLHLPCGLLGRCFGRFWRSVFSVFLKQSHHGFCTGRRWESKESPTQIPILLRNMPHCGVVIFVSQKLFFVKLGYSEAGVWPWILAFHQGKLETASSTFMISLVNSYSISLTIKLGGGFKYVFMFNPTWGNDPI